MKDVPRSSDRDAGKDFPALIASMPVTAEHRRIAIGVVVVLSVVFAFILPYARMPGGRLDSFIPVIQTVVCFADLITAVFLFAQYSIQPQRALLALASGYICSGLFAFLQTLDFPGSYTANGLISGRPGGAAWFFSLWHITFPLAVIAYALMKDTSETARSPLDVEPRRTIAITVACVLAVTATLTWAVAADHLPSMFFDLTRQTPFAQYLSGGMWVLTAIAIVLLFLRMRTILDLWVTVTLIVSLPDLALSFLYPVVRYSVGWYAARGYALIASCTVLVVLLVETTRLYARLASAIILLRRERADRRMSVDMATAAIAHEIAQPLSAVSLGCAAALRWLKGNPPDLEKARTNVIAAANSSDRAAEIIASTREMFKTSPHHRTMIDLNGVARQVLGMLEHDLHENGVSVSVELQEGLPTVMADRVQLQQVVLNLIKNAIDAMCAGPTSARHLGVMTTNGGNSVSLFVQDSGPGIDPGDEARIFDPFFTTKSSGMGLGLSICRMIAEAHGGELRLARKGSIGCTFEIALPE